MFHRNNMWVENLYELKRRSVGTVGVIQHDPRMIYSIGVRIRRRALFGSGVSELFLLWFELTAAKTTLGLYGFAFKKVIGR